MGIIRSKLFAAFKIAKGILICKAEQDTKLPQEWKQYRKYSENCLIYRCVDKRLKQNKFMAKKRR